MCIASITTAFGEGLVILILCGAIALHYVIKYHGFQGARQRSIFSHSL